MVKVQTTVTVKDFAKVKELFEAASEVLPDVTDEAAKNRLALALTAFNQAGGAP